jgi:hypothetical protein
MQDATECQNSVTIREVSTEPTWSLVGNKKIVNLLVPRTSYPSPTGCSLGLKRD